MSPTQINFLVPSGTAMGMAAVAVQTSAADTQQSGTARVASTAPALFTQPCLRTDKGAVLNGVTYHPEPFSAVTAANPGSDQRTRLSIFGTGLRNSPSVSVMATDVNGQSYSLPIEYSGAAPVFTGLDQVNAILPDELSNAGLVSLTLAAGGVSSNAVTILVGDALPIDTAGEEYATQVIAGDGQAGYSGDGAPAINAELKMPAGVAVDAEGNVYESSMGNHVVRKISIGGVITTIAGTGTLGSSGDEGLATQATFNTPAGVAVDPSGNIYVVDSGANRVRRIDTSGVIHAFAGSGTQGSSGDSAAAVSAQLAAPSDVTVDPEGNVVIADSGNNRIRRVTADGLIATLAGTGSAGFAGDGANAFQAQLNQPSSVAVGPDGTLFVGDAGNARIRQVAPDGTISTLAGNGQNGLAVTRKVVCQAARLQFGASVRLATDRMGNLFVSDATNNLLSVIDSNCVGTTIAGANTASTTGDAVSASVTPLNNPQGVAVSPFGDVIFADSGNQVVRELTPATTSVVSAGSSTANACGVLSEIYIASDEIIAGQAATAYVKLLCNTTQDLQVTVTSSDPSAEAPGTVTVPAGQNGVAFTVFTSAVPAAKTIQLSATANGTTVVSPVTVNPAQATLKLTLSPAILTGGIPGQGIISLGAPAGIAGVLVQLLSTNPAVQIAPTVTVPGGQTQAGFLITTSPVTTATSGTLSASSNAGNDQITLAVDPDSSGTGGGTGSGTGSTTGTGTGTSHIGSLTITPLSVTSGQSATATVTLTTPAATGGASVQITTSGPVTAPASVTVPAGANSATFSVTASQVTSATPATVTVSGANSIPVQMTVTPSSGSVANVAAISLNPSSVTGGQASAGTITLNTPAPAGGITVPLTATGPVSVPSSVAIAAGAATGTFPVSTTPVTTTMNGVISSATGTPGKITVNPPCVGTLNLSAASIVGGQGANGTITLTGPAPAGGSNVTLVSASPSIGVPSSVLVPAGQTSAAFPITTSTVATALGSTIEGLLGSCPAVTVEVQLTNGTGTGVGTPVVSGISLNPTSVTGGQPSVGTVTLSGPAPVGGLTVPLSATAPLSVPSAVTIPAGATSGTFPVSSTPVSSPVNGVVSSASGSSALVVVNPPCVSSLGLQATSLVGGQATTGTVSLNGAAPAGGSTVNLSSGNGAIAVPSTVTVPAGSTSTTFPITTSPVLTTLGSTIQGLLGSCPAASATVQLTP